jgi:hypothetical protein
LSAFIPSRPRGLLALLACTLGILAALLVLATLVLLAVNGYPWGLLAAAAGAAIPVALWGAWRLTLRTRIRFWSLEGDRELTAMAEVKVWLVTAPPPPLPADRTIVV